MFRVRARVAEASGWHARKVSWLPAVVGWLAIAFVPVGLRAQDTVAPNAPAEIAGSLVIHGGGPVADSVRSRFVELAGGHEARLVIIPTAGISADDANAQTVLEPWKKCDLASVVLLHTRSRGRANDPAFVKPLTEATGVWLGGADQSRLAEAYLDTAVARELHKLLARGGVIGGTSAGAAVMSTVMITGGNPEATVGRGFGFLPGFVVDQHFLRRKRQDRLVGVLAKNPGLVGLGVDEETAAVVRGRELTVMGKSSAVICLSASSTRPTRFQALGDGKKADIIALERAAIARTQPPFPPARPRVPRVANGTLIIGGGGGLEDGIWKRFIEYAGGPDALIVVIPTANPDPVPADASEARMLRKNGAKNVKVLHTRKRAEADSPAFVAPLKEAGGVWFTGGRQWRFVDAYEGTAAEKAFHEALRRGGVIGGSSAGASIQAEYMVRGDPLGNTVMMAEGYERGFGFLPGAAVDQHFFRRKRTADMTGLMAAHPQLLGIGIDEGTVVVVRGSVLEVVGKSTVAVYDRRRPVAVGVKDYEILTPGSRYDMEKRRRLDKE